MSRRPVRIILLVAVVAPSFLWASCAGESSVVEEPATKMEMEESATHNDIQFKVYDVEVVHHVETPYWEKWAPFEEGLGGGYTTFFAVVDVMAKNKGDSVKTLPAYEDFLLKVNGSEFKPVPEQKQAGVFAFKADFEPFRPGETHHGLVIFEVPTEWIAQEWTHLFYAKIDGK